MEKTGFRRIGYIHNFRDYPRLIREKSGVSFYDYQEFDAHIDTLWTNRTSGIHCYDSSGTEIPVDSDQATLFIMDTGFQSLSDGEAIFAAFQRNAPGSLDDYGWSGVTIFARKGKVDRVSVRCSTSSRNVTCWATDT